MIKSLRLNIQDDKCTKKIFSYAAIAIAYTYKQLRKGNYDKKLKQNAIFDKQYVYH